MEPIQKRVPVAEPLDVNKCVLNLDGYSYMIVATAPERRATAVGAPIPIPSKKPPLGGRAAPLPLLEHPQPQPQHQVLHQAQSAPTQSDAPQTAAPTDHRPEHGSLTILRRNNTYRKRSKPRLVSMLSDSTELLQPRAQDPEACGRAAVRLRHLLSMLDKGEVSPEIIQNNIEYALRVLETFNINEKRCPSEDEEDELSEVQQDAVPPEVREWLASTFTRQNTLHKKRADGQPKFRTVANVIRMGIMVEKMTRRMSSSGLMEVPPAVTAALQSIDSWSYDVFRLAEASGGAPLRHLGYELINRYGLFHKFKIQPAKLDTYLQTVEHGYGRYKNPYHNSSHAADVTQTVHYIMSQMALVRFLTDLEVLAMLLAAIVHDVEHTGTTNNFHVNSSSETALIYNDKSVLENFHVSNAFRILREEECNFLCNLSREEYTELRSLVVDMVLATDMSSHFQQIKCMKNYVINSESAVDKSKILNLVLHCCDISHPSKDWELHSHWTKLLLDEFFLQGDKEKQLGLPVSPLCDRATTLVPQSQIGFIEFIVEPSMSVCGELLEKVAAYLHGAETGGAANGIDYKPGDVRPARPPLPWSCRPWEECLAFNLECWRRKEQAEQSTESRQPSKERWSEEEEGGAGEGEQEKEDVDAESSTDQQSPSPDT
ncbi:calcium/calmodulin-dependent 3',5'-cyclic nucleotide phosphodiesterase 1A-like isoform X3 [Amphibalanus amphitrite]|uniref:calcium/calmodulin-dependent 3',5'-cyclic nucleotide phosphodiesterase 1A-like isoform X3 n=2 Tax=Amphibalanus amphitrite TaxID=1232801 RepID=UPI001C90BD32|nr:calcium/calmodulin-dependent 3',5'-cyclic nucleotide phosphodiesterase 1A-like isoform X3 [Amphibalanus amphitrite]